MSGKYSNKKQIKKQRLITTVVIVALIGVCATVCWLLTDPLPTPDNGTHPSASMQETENVFPSAGNIETKPVHIDEIVEAGIELGRGLWITDVGKYTGVYMEDGSDEVVSGVMMIAVTNAGEEDVQYAEIAMPVGDQTAQFTLSTLPVGKTVILLEMNRMEYVSGEYSEASVTSLAVFPYPLSLREDLLQIQILDGAINVANISGNDIHDDIVIYYKNSAADVYYGGITYRIPIEGGLKAGEIRQVMASRFNQSSSRLLMVTIGG